MSALIEEVRFAMDSPVEGSGFELSVPLRRATTSELSVPPAVNAVGARLPRKRPGVSAVGLASRSWLPLEPERRLAHRHRHHLYRDQSAPYRADPAVGDPGAGHRPLQPFRSRSRAHD